MVMMKDGGSRRVVSELLAGVGVDVAGCAR